MLKQAITEGSLFRAAVDGEIAPLFLHGPTYTTIQHLGISFDTTGIKCETLRSSLGSHEAESNLKRPLNHVTGATGEAHIDAVIGWHPDDTHSVLSQVHHKYQLAFYEGVREGINRAERESGLSFDEASVLEHIAFIAEPFTCPVSGARLDENYSGRLKEAVRRAYAAQQEKGRYGITEVTIPSIFGVWDSEDRRIPTVEHARPYHGAMLDAIAEQGSTMVIAETINTTADALAIAQEAQTRDMKVLLSLMLSEKNTLRTGESATDTFSQVLDTYGGTVQAIGFNCSPYQRVHDTLSSGFPANLSRLLLGSWINAGEVSSADDGIHLSTDRLIRDDLAEYSRKHSSLIDISPARYGRLVSGCCATNPPYFKELVAKSVVGYLLEHKSQFAKTRAPAS